MVILNNFSLISKAMYLPLLILTAIPDLDSNMLSQDKTFLSEHTLNFRSWDKIVRIVTRLQAGRSRV
jgi:hypothetical protein